MRLIRWKAILIRTRSAITSPLFRTIPVATWRIPPLLISTRAGANTKKMSITCAYLHRAVVHRHRHLRLVQRPQRQPRQRQQLHRLQQLLLLLLLLRQLRLRQHQHLQLLLLLDPRQRQDLSRRRGRVPHQDPGRDLVVDMTLCGRAGMWSRLDRARRLQQKNLLTRALCEFSSFSLVTN